MCYYNFDQAAMVKLVDTLLLGSSARASRFESEWRHPPNKKKEREHNRLDLIENSIFHFFILS